VDFTSLILVTKSYHWATMSVHATIKVNSQPDADPVHGPSEPSHEESDRLVVWAACVESSKLFVYGTLPVSLWRGTVSGLSHSGLHLEVVKVSHGPGSQTTSATLACTPDLADRVKRLVGIVVTSGNTCYHALRIVDLCHSGLTRNNAELV
jgi:hypothetical protein